MTLQQVLDNGSTLNKDTAINCADFAFEILNSNYFRVEGVNQGATARISYDCYSPQFPEINLYVNDTVDFVKVTLKTSGLSITKNNGNPKNIVALNVEDDYSDDTAAGEGGVLVGELYHTSGAVKIRLT